jgi:hypothetical protein
MILATTLRVQAHKKSKPPAIPCRDCGRNESGQLNFFLFGRGGGGLCGLRLDEALLKFVHATGGIHEFLRAGIERVAGIADADDDGGLGGAGLNYVATGATDFRVSVFRMYVRLHNKKD